MFGHHYFGARYFGPRYFGDGGSGIPPQPPSVAPDVWWPVFVQRERRRKHDEEERLNEEERKRIIRKAEKKVMRIIDLGPAAAARTSLTDIIEQVAPNSISEPDWDAIYQRIEASARRAILRKQEDEDEEEALLLLLH